MGSVLLRLSQTGVMAAIQKVLLPHLVMMTLVALKTSAASTKFALTTPRLALLMAIAVWVVAVWAVSAVSQLVKVMSNVPQEPCATPQPNDAKKPKHAKKQKTTVAKVWCATLVVKLVPQKAQGLSVTKTLTAISTLSFVISAFAPVNPEKLDAKLVLKAVNVAKTRTFAFPMLTAKNTVRLLAKVEPSAPLASSAKKSITPIKLAKK